MENNRLPSKRNKKREKVYVVKIEFDILNDRQRKRERNKINKN